jgi:hypothetical protein
MFKETLQVKESWKEKGVGIVLAHPDDESLMWGLMECLC